MVAYRSEFLHLWVVAATAGADVDPLPIIEALLDLEREALRLPPGVVPPPGVGLPVEIQHALAGLQFLRDTLWEAHADFAGLLSHGGRVWAVRSGLDVTLEQLTGAPARWRWHEWEGGSVLAWTELGAAEVWGAEINYPGGALYAHYRPPLATVPHAPATEADAFAAAALAQARAEAQAQARAQANAPPDVRPDAQAEPLPGAPAPAQRPDAMPPMLEGESRHARRRRRKREAGAQGPRLVPVTEARITPSPTLAAPPRAPMPTLAVIHSTLPEETNAEPNVELTAEPPAEFNVEPPAELTAELPAELTVEPPAPPRVVPIRITTPRPAPAPTRPARRQAARPSSATGPALRWPRIPGLERVPRGAVIGAAIAVVLGGLIAAGVAARKPITALVVGRYTLDLTTSPAGARVRVDGKPEAARTPIVLALEPGEHRIEVNYGDYASAGFDIDGSRGDHLQRDFTWAGSLGVASADSSVRLAVTLDGKALGQAPLWRDSIPVGRHRLGFTAPGVRSWEEEVQVRAGQSARVSAVPVKVPNYGLVTARAELVSSDGVEDLDGIPVFVDGTRVGVTPTDLKLTPGPHSIRIARAEGAPSIHLIDVQAGGRFYASAEFGRPADPIVVFDAPTKVSRAAPPTLAIRLDADLPLPVRQASLYIRPDGGPEGSPFARLPVTWSSGAGRSQGSIAFPVDHMGPARTLTYYVEIETREGEEYFSELHTIPVVP